MTEYKQAFIIFTETELSVNDLILEIASVAVDLWLISPYDLIVDWMETGEQKKILLRASKEECYKIVKQLERDECDNYTEYPNFMWTITDHLLAIGPGKETEINKYINELIL